MQEDALNRVISRSAALMEQFERRSHTVEEHWQSLSHEVQASTQQLPGLIKQSADSSLRTLPDQVLSKVREGLEQPVRDYQQQLRAAGAEVNGGAHALAQQIERMERVHRLLIWKVVGVTAASLLLLLAGGLWLSMHYTSVIRENQLSAELMKAYNAADVVLCEGKLCVNVDAKSKRYGSKGEYQPVKDR